MDTIFPSDIYSTMAKLSLREFAASAALSLLLGLLCLGLLPGTEAKYDVSMFRTYFGCPPCDEGLCKTPVGCELVDEPGVCSCCMTCARQEGDFCGISTTKCGQGLRCNPPENSINGFEALFEGKGMCEPAEELFPGFPMSRRSQWKRSRQAGFGYRPKF